MGQVENNGNINTFKREILKKAAKFVGAQMEQIKQADPNINSEKLFKENEEFVTPILDIPYTNRAGVKLGMDIIQPKVKEGTEVPVIVYIHGGGLIVGDRILSRSFEVQLAKRGYLVFGIEYRHVPEVNACEQFDDVCAGMDIVGRKLVEFDVDLSRIFLVAESAGAFLGLYVAAMKKSPKLQEVIGYKPTNMVFRAIGLISGMFYTNQADPIGMCLSELIYGDKIDDLEFKRYTNPEEREIIRNLPPTFLVTGRGDFLNRYTLMYKEALDKAGVKNHLLYYGEDYLKHSFVTFHPDLEQSLDAIEKMLAWFEEAAKSKKENNMSTNAKAQKLIEERIKDGSIAKQKAWMFIKELNSYSEERLDSVAVIDGCREYTFRQYFRLWDRYAEVFSGLGITGKNKSRVVIIGNAVTEVTACLYALNMVGSSVSGMMFMVLQKLEALKNL